MTFIVLFKPSHYDETYIYFEITFYSHGPLLYKLTKI